MYDETLDQCVGSSTAAPSSTDTYATQPATTTTPSSTTNTTTASTTTTTESFITEAMVERMLTKQEHGKYKADFVYDGNNRIQPNEPYSFIYKN